MEIDNFPLGAPIKESAVEGFLEADKWVGCEVAGVTRGWGDDVRDGFES